MTDASLKVAFENYPHIRDNFRICQAVEGMTGEFDIEQHPEHFLDSLTMRAETLRHSLHLRIKYSNGNWGDMYYLRAECDPDDLEAVHDYLEDHEPTPGLPWTTMGKYPSHSTMGEGYTWRHINAYAELANTATQHAWASTNGLKDHLSKCRVKSKKKKSKKSEDESCADKVRGHNGKHWTDVYSRNEKKLSRLEKLRRMNPLRTLYTEFNIRESVSPPEAAEVHANASSSESCDLTVKV